MTGYDEFLRRVPKVELHCHFEGTVRPGTFADLARKHGVALPTDDVDRLYDYDSIYEFLKIFAMVSSTLIDQEDFARAAYESIEDGVKLGNLRYREMFFNPTLHTKRGVPYKTVVDGLVDGIQAAESDFGVPCRLIADVYRQDSPAEAREMVEQVLEHRRDELIGLGMDGAEAPDPPEQFVDAYRLAGSGGLRLTAHACEDAPAQNIATCLDVLGCERIDHGYHILGDDALVERCRDEGITFTVCPTATAVCYFDPEDYTTHPIREMAARGLKIMVNSDDPSMFHTDIGTEYVKMANAAEWGVDTVRELSLNGVDGSWLSDDEKRRMRQEFTEELERLGERRSRPRVCDPMTRSVNRRSGRSFEGGHMKKAGLTYVVLLLSLVGALVLAASGGAAEAKPIKAAWIYVGPHNDGGWSQAHDDGRLYVQKMLGQEGRHDVQGERPRGAADGPGDRRPRARRQQDHLRHVVRLHGRDGGRSEEVPGRVLRARDRLQDREELRELLRRRRGRDLPLGHGRGSRDEERERSGTSCRSRSRRSSGTRTASRSAFRPYGRTRRSGSSGRSRGSTRRRSGRPRRASSPRAST